MLIFYQPLCISNQALLLLRSCPTYVFTQVSPWARLPHLIPSELLWIKEYNSLKNAALLYLCPSVVSVQIQIFFHNFQGRRDFQRIDFSPLARFMARFREAGCLRPEIQHVNNYSQCMKQDLCAQSNQDPSFSFCSILLSTQLSKLSNHC